MSMQREGKKKKKRQPMLLPVMCLRGEGDGWRDGSENSVQKDLRKGWGGSAV